jgi:hypothetical protein
MEKYSWFKDYNPVPSEEPSYTVVHNEGKIETIIAITDTAEKADFIAKACNQFSLLPKD